MTKITKNYRQYTVYLRQEINEELRDISHKERKYDGKTDLDSKSKIIREAILDWLVKYKDEKRRWRSISF